VGSSYRNQKMDNTAQRKVAVRRSKPSEDEKENARATTATKRATTQRTSNPLATLEKKSAIVRRVRSTLNNTNYK
jgi:hypothetical protein